MTGTCGQRHYVYIERFVCSLFMLQFGMSLLSYFSIDVLCIHVSFCCYRVRLILLLWYSSCMIFIFALFYILFVLYCNIVI